MNVIMINYSSNSSTHLELKMSIFQAGESAKNGNSWIYLSMDTYAAVCSLRVVVPTLEHSILLILRETWASNLKEGNWNTEEKLPPGAEKLDTSCY